MKKLLTAIILLVIVAVAVSAFAGDTNVKFPTATIINGQKIEPGQYTLKYDIKGNIAEVKVLQNQKTVATTTANVIESKDKAAYDGVVRESNQDGTSTLKELQFANKKQVIRFEGNGSAVGK